MKIVDDYRYRVGEKKKKVLEARIRDEEDQENVVPRKRSKRQKNVYLVNRNKFWAVVNEATLGEEITDDSMDEKKHQILQHRIRK